MIRIYSARSIAEAHLVRTTLTESGILVEVRGHSRPGLAGEIPIPDAMVDVWVNESQADLAKLTLDAIEAKAHLGWICVTCGEENPASFETCWKCPQP